MSMHRRGPILALIILGLTAHGGVARADVAASMTSDLQQAASAVPGAQVSIGAPAGQETLMGPSATTIAHVTMSVPAGRSLAGVTASDYTTADAQEVIWELAVIESAKHAIAAGNRLDGISITENVAGQPPESSPDMTWSLLGQEITSQPPATMSVDDVNSAVKNSLPPWAATASVDVVEDAVRERVVTLTLELPPIAFRALDVPGLVGILLERQNDLSASGAEIGRVIVKVTDSSTQDPLYFAAADATIGMQTFWLSPLVQGLVGSEASLSATKPGDTASQAGDTANQAVASPSTAVGDAGTTAQHLAGEAVTAALTTLSDLIAPSP